MTSQPAHSHTPYLFVFHAERFTLYSQLISYGDKSLYDWLYPVVTHGSCLCTCVFFIASANIYHLDTIPSLRYFKVGDSQL